MSKLLIIGFNSIAGAGKDTITDELVASHGWWRASVADEMRSIAVARGGSLEWYVDRNLKEIPRSELGFITPRQDLINIGREGRANGVTYWIDKLQVTINAAAAAGVPGIAIPDIGSAVEADWVRARGGSIIRLERPGVEPIPDGRELVEPNSWIANDKTPQIVAHRCRAFALAWQECRVILERVANDTGSPRRVAQPAALRGMPVIHKA